VTITYQAKPEAVAWLDAAAALAAGAEIEDCAIQGIDGHFPLSTEGA